MQSLDVQVQKPESAPTSMAGLIKSGGKTALNGKTGAETARNGSSFLAMIEKMIAGTMEGKTDALKASSLKTAGRGAGNATDVPGDGNILKKTGSGKGSKPVSNVKTEPAAVMSAKDKKKPAADKGLSPVHAASEAGAGSVTAASVLKDGLGPDPVSPGSENADLKTEALKNKKTGNGEADTGVAVLLSGMQNAGTAQKKASAQDAAPEADSSSGKKIEKTERKDKKTVISVRDERASDGNSAGSPLAKSVRVNNDGTADMTIGFRDAQSGSGVNTDTESRFMEKADGKQGQSFASMLSSELRSNAADFVKTGSIVLRENNSGLIRLTLNPESLGNVKISLELSSDKRITGKIVVSSKEAYDAFNENLDGLSDAFVAGGFESAGFDLSWSGQDSQADAQKEAFGKISSPFYASAIPEVMPEGNPADTLISGYRNTSRTGINVFA